MSLLGAGKLRFQGGFSPVYANFDKQLLSDFQDERILNLAETYFWSAGCRSWGSCLEPESTLQDHRWVHCTARHSKAFVGHDVFRGPSPRCEGTTAQHRKKKKKKIGRCQNRHPTFRRQFLATNPWVLDVQGTHYHAFVASGRHPVP